MVSIERLFIFFLVFWHHSVWGRECADHFRWVIRQNSTSETEAKFLGMGFSEQYTDGLDKVDSYLQLAKELRKPGVDPNKTHIPFFAVQIDKHLDFIGAGAMALGSTASLQKQLRLFRERAHKRQELRQVTYAWWIEWNAQLVTLATSKVKRFYEITSETTFPPLPAIDNSTPYFGRRKREEVIFWQKKEYSTRERFSQAISLFPQLIMMPTIDDMGLMAFNRTFPLGVSFLGMLNRSTEGWIPQGFFLHDVGHSLNRINQMGKRADYKVVEPFHNAIMEMVENREMSKEQREAFEYLYFFAGHEWPKFFKAIMGASLKKKIERFQSYVPFVVFNYVPLDNLLPKNVGLEGDAIERFFVENINFIAEEILLKINR